MFGISGCQVSIFSYFFLFFGLPPIFSYFFKKLLVFPFFRVLLGTQKHSEIFETKLPIKLINSTKKLKLHVKKDQFEAFLSDFLLKLVGQKGKQLTDKQQKLLEKAISSTANAAKKRAKLRLPNLLKERKQYTGSVGRFGCWCSKVVVGFYCEEDIHLVTVNLILFRFVKKLLLLIVLTVLKD